jgi:putative ABC transport system permease protein
MQLREQPLRTALTALAIGLGVALGTAVYLINAAALSDFEHASRQLLGTADLSVRSSASGFDQQLFVTLAHQRAVEDLSPMLDLDVTLPNRRQSLEILGLDPFRAQSLDPALAAALAADVAPLFAADAIVLSQRAADQLGLRQASRLSIVVGSTIRSLRVVDVLPTEAVGGAVGLMDIAAAQWTLARLGRLNRIDLRLRSGVDSGQFRRQLAATLPAGAVVVTPQMENARDSSATRAYRVNLNMLASVALLTGAFLVFSTQSLAVLRRRVALGLLRALGVTRGELQRALLAEGVVLGLLGSLLGLALGVLIAALIVRYRGADLGNAQLHSIGAALVLAPGTLAAFLLGGTAAAALGAWLPAREAARRAPALALRAGDAESALPRGSNATALGLLLLFAGVVLALLPVHASLPWSGYLAIGALLFGAVLLIPLLLRSALALLPSTGRAIADVARAQLQGSAGAATVSLAGVVVSFSLMIAMAIMVHSFRASFELWLVKLLPADLQLRAAVGSDTGTISAPEQQRIAQLPSVLRVDFRRLQTLYLRPDRDPVTLIARDISAASAAQRLPLVQSVATPLPPAARPAWVSESLADLDGVRPGSALALPLGGRLELFYVAGIWRDYQHSGGAIVIDRGDYIGLTGDHSATEAAIWQRPHGDTALTEAAIRSVLGDGTGLEMLASSELRERSLDVFDRVFAITYALEAVAVLVGLGGISVAASSAALARRAQFGMLRHIGMLRRQVLAMLACEGVALSALAALYGLLLGGALSLVLIYVINRRSFHWSIDLSVPWGELVLLSAAVIAAAAVTAVWSGRAAMSQDAVRAVREDW